MVLSAKRRSTNKSRSGVDSSALFETPALQRLVLHDDGRLTLAGTELCLILSRCMPDRSTFSITQRAAAAGSDRAHQITQVTSTPSLYQLLGGGQISRTFFRDHRGITLLAGEMHRFEIFRHGVELFAHLAQGILWSSPASVDG